jgi:hypothetical protein
MQTHRWPARSTRDYEDIGDSEGEQRLDNSSELQVSSESSGAATRPYSHSMVPGGFEVTSSTTRLTSRTSFVMRFEIFASTS